MTTPPHHCDDQCVCPEHGTPMFYARTSDEHACQNPECQYAHGDESVLAKYIAEELPKAAAKYYQEALDREIPAPGEWKPIGILGALKTKTVQEVVDGLPPGTEVT